jgi:uncharacterized repeat protein (TIGR03806 family)
LIDSVTRADNRANYRCVVSNAFGKATSSPAPLTVRATWEEEMAHELGGLLVHPRPGTYSGPITARLFTRTGPAELRYTTDGSNPTRASGLCARPIPLKRTTTLKVQVFRKGKAEGKPVALRFNIKGNTPYGLTHRARGTTLPLPPLPEKAPGLLSQTGVFASLDKLRPNAGVVPYGVNSPLWSDGAEKQRWIALAPGGQIGFAATGEWAFPAGTVFVKQFEIGTDDTNPRVKRRLETRLLVVDGTGYGYGVTYKWRPDNRDADLLADSATEDIKIKTAAGTRTQKWYYPSRTDCLTCHTASARFVLGVKTRQLNGSFPYPETGVRDNQLRTWNYLGMFRPALDEGKIGGLSKLVAVGDTSAAVEVRARSYLDANCANCHRPGNTIRANFDARFDTPLVRQSLIDAGTVSDSLNIIKPKVITPRDPARSMLYHRLTRTDNFKMPPLATNVKDRVALAVLKEWISRLPAARPPRDKNRKLPTPRPGRPPP